MCNELTSYLCMIHFSMLARFKQYFSRHSRLNLQFINVHITLIVIYTDMTDTSVRIMPSMCKCISVHMSYILNHVIASKQMLRTKQSRAFSPRSLLRGSCICMVFGVGIGSYITIKQRESVKG